MQEVIKMLGKVRKVHEGVISRETLKILLLEKLMWIFFNLRFKHQDEGNDIMQSLWNYLWIVYLMKKNVKKLLRITIVGRNIGWAQKLTREF